MDWQGAIGVAVGVLGVAVSWWAAFGGWRSRRPNLDVALAYGTLDAGQHSFPAVWIRVVNRGAVDVEIESVGLVAPGDRRLACEPWGSGLHPGSMLHARTGGACWLAPREVAQALMSAGCIGTVELRAYCVDALGNECRSVAVPFEARMHRLDSAPASRLGMRDANE